MSSSDDAIRKVLRPDTRLSDLCRHVSGKAGKSPVRRAAAEAPRTTKPKLPTYAQARAALLERFRQARWNVIPGLKVPHATSEDDEVRFWLKPQAVWVSRGKHTLATARSTGVDMRQPQAFEKLITAYAEPKKRTARPAPAPTTVPLKHGPFAREVLRDVKGLERMVPLSKAYALYKKRTASPLSVFEFEGAMVEAARKNHIDLKGTPQTIYIINPYPAAKKSAAPASPAKNSSSLERQIVSLLKKSGPEMTIMDVRQRFPGKSASEMDAALKSLFRKGTVVLYPEDNTQTLALNPFMQMGRLVVSGEAKHWVRLEHGPDRPGPFSRQVLQAVKAAPASARFGPGKVFISEAFKGYKRGGGSVSNLADFKRILAHANQRGELRLVRADLVGAMDPEKVRASEMRYLNAEFHFILDPSK